MKLQYLYINPSKIPQTHVGYHGEYTFAFNRWGDQVCEVKHPEDIALFQRILGYDNKPLFVEYMTPRETK